MISNTRKILVVMAMTSALCADQVAVAAPSSGPRVVEIAEMAHRLVSRLSESFRETVPSALQEPTRQSKPAARPIIPVITAPLVAVAHCAACPFQFRLPPPPIR